MPLDLDAVKARLSNWRMERVGTVEGNAFLRLDKEARKDAEALVSEVERLRSEVATLRARVDDLESADWDK